MSERTTFDEARGRPALKALNLVSAPTAFVVRRLPPLSSAEGLMSAARLFTRREDFGEPDIREPLEHLIGPLVADDTLTPVGELIEREKLFRLLCSRLRVVHHLARNPGIRETRLDRPIFIVGLPRTGTTLLQHVISSHPDVRAVEGWESLDPLPTSPKIRRRQYAAYLGAVKLIVPAALTVHPMQVEGPEEGLEMIERTFHSRTMSFFGYPEYAEWLASRSTAELVEAYEVYVNQLRMLTSQRPGRLLVKSPALLGLQNVLSRYCPDASFIATHRDLRAVIPSSLSLAAVAQSASRRVEPAALGSRLLTDLEGLTESILSGIEGVPADRMRDVRFHELMADPVGVCEELFTWLGLEVPDDLEERVDAVGDALPRHKFGRHVYRLDQYGLDESDFADLADSYADQFGLRRESAR